MARKTSKAAVALNTTRIDLAADTRRKVVALLQQQLADTFDLFSQIKQAHWTVSGPQFIALHELFDKFAGEVSDSRTHAPHPNRTNTAITASAILRDPRLIQGRLHPRSASSHPHHSFTTLTA